MGFNYFSFIKVVWTHCVKCMDREDHEIRENKLVCTKCGNEK